MVLGQLDIHIQKNEVRSLPHILYKISKWIKDLNIRAKSIKLLEKKKKTGVNLHNLGLRNGLLDMTPNAQATKEKIVKYKNWAQPKFKI